MVWGRGHDHAGFFHNLGRAAAPKSQRLFSVTDQEKNGASLAGLLSIIAKLFASSHLA